jgi:exosortase B
MSAVISVQRPHADQLPWILAGLGFVGMYAPTFWNASQGLWKSDDFSHGPIILAVLIWLFWTKRAEIFTAPTNHHHWLAWPLFLLGVLLYLFGRLFEISSFEFGSLLLIAPSVLLLLGGASALRLGWFPLLYLVFLVPLPATLVDAITGPLKNWISTIVVELLYHNNYPVARTGVMINVGPYQLLVADACSGLHSMFSLSALGTLYMYLMSRKRWLHNGLMLAAILPIAFFANIVRVVILVLVTYHLGDEAGQGFLHGLAGMVLMLAALLFFFLLDTLLAWALRRNESSRGSV